ncbi:MAG: histidine phosphatase family protein [Gammaproteobacteria bacterium]|nr:histidine phosphatase family protein [Gammaproteobacteria bacterium]
MFELMLLRHAKSDWHNFTADIDRPLNQRGIDEAVRLGVYLNKIKLRPDRMVVSTAVRAQQTAESVLLNMPIPEKNIISENELYLADRETLIETVELYAAEGQRLLILAHNPGMDDIVSYLASERPSLSASGKLMTTCTLACFRIDSLEALKKPGKGELQRLIRPADTVDPYS